MEMMSWDQFSGLDGDCKVEEIKKLLPLVSWIREDVETVKRDVSSLRAALQEERNNTENVVLHGMEGREARDGPDIDTARSGQEEVSFISTSSKDWARSGLQLNSLHIAVNVMSDRDHSVPEPYVIAKSRSQHKRVKLNVGGIRYLGQHAMARFTMLMLGTRLCGRSFILFRIPSLECWRRFVVMINGQ